jgi:hypothetical protein
MPAFRMTGFAGETFDGVQDYLQHLVRNLPEAYRASRDYKDYVEALIQVGEGRMTAEQAAGKMPALRRVAGACPCSKSVRWMIDQPASAEPAGQPAA